MSIQLQPIENIGKRAPAAIDRTAALEMVRVTEAAARAAARFQGRGDKNQLDEAAVDAMRRALNDMPVHGTVVIGEGEKDDAPMLYIGEVVGTPDGRNNGPKLDIAVDPVDGTTLAAKGDENAISVIAIGEAGSMLDASAAYYMDKIAVGPGIDINAFDMDMPADEIVRIAASQKGVSVDDIVVCTLDRPRHEMVIANVRKAGARMKLIPDGDVYASIATCAPETGIDVLIGRGGAPEAVISAAALKCMGGNIMGRLYVDNDAMKERIEASGIKDVTQTFTTEDLAAGEVIFAASGVTDGNLLKGVRRTEEGELTESIVMRSATGTIRRIETLHRC